MTGPPSTEHHEQPLLSTDMVVNSEHQKVNGQMRTDVEEAELVMVETQNSETTTDTVCQSSSLQPSSTSSPILNSITNEEIITPMLTDPSLPTGWSRRVTQRTMGASAGKYDVYIFSPDRKKIRSRTDLMLYLAKSKLELNVNDFDFSVRGRANTPPKRPSQQKTSKPKKPLTTPKQTTIKVPKAKVNSKSKSNLNQATSQIQKDPTSTGPKLVVKFNFPVARLKRSPSLKTKKTKHATKEGLSRQDSQTSQASLPVAAFECHEELSNGETRLTNGLDIEDIQMDTDEMTSDVLQVDE